MKSNEMRIKIIYPFRKEGYWKMYSDVVYFT